MLSSIGSHPDEDIFVTIIRSLGRARMIREVIKVLDLVKKFDVVPSLKVYNSILDVLVKEDIDVARKFFREKMMGSKVQGDAYTFGILMKGVCLTNRIFDGFKLLALMKSSPVKPNTVIYNTLLHALCRNGKVGRARSLMNEVMEPNDITFNIMISGYCKEENLVQALVLLEKSFSSGFVPDVVTLTKVLELVCGAGRLMEAVEILERVEARGGAVDAFAYNTLIKGFCRSGKVKVGLRLLKDMEIKGCLPNIDTYNILITAFCETKMLDSAIDMFNEMKIVGLKWNFATFHALICGLCSGGRMDDGFKILELMEETKGGSSGCISPYNSILYGLYKQNSLDESLKFLISMQRLFPRYVDRSLTILDFCNESSMESAKDVYDQMKNEGGLPNAIVFDHLIRGFCKEGRVRDAFELLNEMIASSYFPVSSTFNALISGFCVQGKVLSALKLLEDVLGRECVADVESYTPLIDAFCREGDLDKALKLFREMVDKGIVPNRSTWNSLLASVHSKSISNQSSCFLNDRIQSIIEP